MSLDCVVDANVCVKVFVVESLTAAATELFSYLAHENPPQFHVPDLFYIECANILWKYVVQYGYQGESAQQDVEDILAFPLLATPSATLAQEALEVGLANGIAAYDAAYVILAQRLGVPFVTADEKLVRKLRHTPYDVRWLGVWP